MPADERTPGYYRGTGGLQPLDVIQAFGLGFEDGSVIKYVCRWRRKDGLKDLRKARHYLDMLIAAQEAAEKVTAGLDSTATVRPGITYSFPPSPLRSDPDPT